MPDYVYLNGEFVHAHEAKISVFDHGFLYGDGLFETMRAYNGKVFLLYEHLDRLFRSAEILEIEIPLTRKEISAALDKLIFLNGDNLYMRLTLSRGPGPVGIDPGLCPEPTMVIMSKTVGVNERLYTEGARAVFVKTPRNLAEATRPDIKSLNFLNNILAKQEVIRAGADEGFLLNYLGEVTEGTVSNVLLVRGNLLMTPHIDSGLLNGITRQKILEIASKAGFEVRESTLFPVDFRQADEVFYCNSGSEVVPVTVLDGKSIGTGKPGYITQKILSEYRKCAQS